MTVTPVRRGGTVSGVPDWEDEYLDRVSDRLMYSYDLEKDRRVDGERFGLYGRLEVENHKQFLHPSISYGHHEKVGHLFVRRADGVTAADLDRLADLGETLAEEWIDPDERHYETEFVFALVVPEIPEEVGERVVDLESRTLLSYGYHGHYWLRFVVVSPENETVVASPGADVAAAFRLWSEGGEKGDGESGVLGRFRSLLGFSRRS
ncbi:MULTISPECIES: hypothetical protein [Salinirubellus]|uniref:hypothetical protein n=1 Tax=Salinirubellus TaxID=2162630 RepID=UPI0030D17675